MRKSNKPLLVVLSSPSGGGKTVIANLLLRRHPEYSRSISITTREKRKGEKEEVDYYFVDQKDFQRKINRDEFVEWAKVFGDYYGTPKKSILKTVGKIKVLLLVLDVQGGLTIKRKYPESVLIFILPPSLPELKKRLVNRNTDRPDMIKRRLRTAIKEIEFCKKYDYLVVNKTLGETVELIENIIIAEEHRAGKMFSDSFFKKNQI
jgi:guanylate kinase